MVGRYLSTYQGFALIEKINQVLWFFFLSWRGRTRSLTLTSSNWKKMFNCKIVILSLILRHIIVIILWIWSTILVGKNIDALTLDCHYCLLSNTNMTEAITCCKIMSCHCMPWWQIRIMDDLEPTNGVAHQNIVSSQGVCIEIFNELVCYLVET